MSSQPQRKEVVVVECKNGEITYFPHGTGLRSKPYVRLEEKKATFPAATFPTPGARCVAYRSPGGRTEPFRHPHMRV